MIPNYAPYPPKKPVYSKSITYSEASQRNNTNAVSQLFEENFEMREQIQSIDSKIEDCLQALNISNTAIAEKINELHSLIHVLECKLNEPTFFEKIIIKIKSFFKRK